MLRASTCQWRRLAYSYILALRRLLSSLGCAVDVPAAQEIASAHAGGTVLSASILERHQLVAVALDAAGKRQFQERNL